MRPLGSSIPMFIDYKLFDITNYPLRVWLCSELLWAVRGHSHSYWIPWSEIWSSIQQLQPQRLTCYIFSPECVNISKMKEDTQSIPVGHMSVTLNERAAGSPDHCSATWVGPNLHPYPNELHCFVNCGLFATDPLDLSLSLPLIQNGSVLTALLVLLYIYFLYLEPLLCLSLPHFSTAATIMSL